MKFIFIFYIDIKDIHNRENKKQFFEKIKQVKKKLIIIGLLKLK
jgi:prephenate dehydratase